METCQSKTDEPVRDSYGLPGTACKILESDPLATLEFCALREAHNNWMAQLNSNNQSLRSAINSFVNAHRCLKQLARELPTPDESLEAILQPMNSTPDNTIRLKSAWQSNIEAIDDKKESWQMELDCLGQRLKNVQAQ